jgi:hypothetical protein
VSEDEAVALASDVKGWLSEPEIRVLYRSTVDALRRNPSGMIVEIGSYHGRSTVVLASAARDAGYGTRILAIDPHEGNLTGLQAAPSWGAFLENIDRSGLSEFIVPLLNNSSEVALSSSDRIAMLLVDGLHDAASVAADYAHFGPHVPVGGLIAFHDYWNTDYPGVRSVADARIVDGQLRTYAAPPKPSKDDSLLVTQKLPRLSIIIPTCGRMSLGRTLESIAREGGLLSDEIIVVGDGPQQVAQTIVESFNNGGRLFIRYLEHGPTHVNGIAQRNFAMPLATGTHLMFLDDDDVPAEGAIRTIRQEIVENPDRPLIFREESRTPRHPWGVVWKDREIRRGNVGTQGIVVPNVQARLGSWGNSYEGDYDFARTTVDLYPNRDKDVVWVDRVVAYLY